MRSTKGTVFRFANDPISKDTLFKPVNGPVTSYKLSDEELERYRNLKPETDNLGLPLRRTIAQKTKHKLA
ncbi:hypothetical protein [Paenibacillus chitinolyticus]|uniref:hypothetical protein n=1 Tax=Paenibacillus chitinolyticus TaxID=79263 RepID=UPI00366CE628